jgi:hypothetical protein
MKQMDLNILKDTPPWEWPRDAAKKFLAILRNPQAGADERLVAADLAGDMVAINDALVDALLAIVGNSAEPEELRAKAAISLGPVLEQSDIEMGDEGEFDDPDSVPISEKTFRKIQQSLRKIYLDSAVPKLVRRRILEAAVRAPEDWQSQAIRTAYSNDDPEWKLTAVFGMRYVRGFEKQILEALESADPKIRYEAVTAAGNRELDAAWPHISSLLTSSATSKDLLLAAIEAAAVIRPREAVPLLMDLADSEDEDIAEAADEAVSMAESAADDDFDDEEYEGDDEDEDEDEPRGGNHKSVH